jgi:hypothetical protein
MNVKSFIQDYQLLSYFVLAYSITWSGILILLVSKGFDFSTIHGQEAPTLAPSFRISVGDRRDRLCRWVENAFSQPAIE